MLTFVESWAEMNAEQASEDINTFCFYFTGCLFQALSTMSTESTADQLLKRPNEENHDDSIERVTKKAKTDEENAEDGKRYPKKKVALLLAYSGKGYYGMQVCCSFTVLLL